MKMLFGLASLITLCTFHAHADEICGPDATAVNLSGAAPPTAMAITLRATVNPSTANVVVWFAGYPDETTVLHHIVDTEVLVRPGRLCAKGSMGEWRIETVGWR
jgi:hypothetical protein